MQASPRNLSDKLHRNMFAAFCKIRIASIYAFASAMVLAMLPPTFSQAQDPRKDQPEVLRVSTQLVQTDVMVFDRQGEFVKDLKLEDFELRIDGKPRTVEFFERVTTGSPNEESQLAAARGAIRGADTKPLPLDRGRPVFFYIDDLHLDPSSMYRTRLLLNKFVNQEMRQNDEVAITSASGQIGFLQQLTDNKTVLRLAIERLTFRNTRVRDIERPPMTEYQALQVSNYNRDLTDYFVEETLKDNPGITRESALSMVEARARLLLVQAARVTSDSLSGLEGLVKSAQSMPGRKLVFFISDGFLIDNRNNTIDKLRRITSAAAKSGVVIYSIDARGLVATLADASNAAEFDPSGRLERASMGELVATQNGLNALARDTGGKPYFNSNALEPSVRRALDETSTYYLLAWKPDPDADESRKFRRIEVKVIGKPGLTVHVRRGFFDNEPSPPASKNKPPTRQPSPDTKPRDELGKVMGTPFPEREIPITLRLNYLDLPGKGMVLSASMKVPREFLSFAAVNGKETALVEVGGMVFNVKGQQGANFNNRKTVTQGAPGLKDQDLAYGHQITLPPGLYHVRVAARDEKSRRAGSAHGWIEIPDLSKGKLTLSSVFVGTRPLTEEASVRKGDFQNQLGLSVDNRFAIGDYLRFMIFTYNAARSPTEGRPDLAIQVQILRDQQPVVTTPLKKATVEPTMDFVRIPYAAEVSLAGLPAGRYILRITAVDRVSKTSASQEARFELQ